MSEEKKPATQPAKDKHPAPSPKAEKERPAPAPVPQETGKPKRLKITQMSLQEVEKALEKARQFMGGVHSHYAQALQARKEFLTKQPQPAKHHQTKAA